MRRVLSFAAASLVLLAATAVAQEFPYVVTDSAGTFTVRRNNIVVGGAQHVLSLDVAISAIRNHALGMPVTIQFGAGDGDTLDVGTGSFSIGYNAVGSEVALNLTKIKLTGNITSGTTTTLGTVRLHGSYVSAPTPLVEVEIAANIVHTGESPTTSPALVVDSDYFDVTITGGTITSVSGRAISASSGNLTITDGVFMTSGGGEVLERTGGGSTTITGGKFEAKGNGYVISANASGKFVISGEAEFVSSSTVSSAINIRSMTGLEISGGKISNTADGGHAISILNVNGGALTLGNTPEITGAIATNFAGRITVDTSFTPEDNKYVLDLIGSARDYGAVAVIGGAAHIASFVLDAPPYDLAARDGDIILTLHADFIASRYVITGDAVSGYVATKGTDTIGTGPNINNILSDIRGNAANMPCTIQFGNGTQVLDVGNVSVIFSTSGVEGWGKITLTGRMTSETTGNQGGTIFGMVVQDGITVHNTADIRHTVHRGAVRLNSGANFTHLSGNIDGINNASNGTLTIAGGTVNTVSNTASGAMVITGGIIGDSTMMGPVVTGSVTISGTAMIISADTTGVGTVENRSHSNGITITGGTILNVAENGGIAVSNRPPTGMSSSNGFIAISGDAVITSKYAGNTGATVYSTTGGLVEITGGKISNIGEGSAVYVIRTRRDGDSTGVFAPILSISGTAEITSNGVYVPTVTIEGGGGGNDTILTYGGIAEISGGKISNTRIPHADTMLVPLTAVRIANGRLIISGDADISANSVNMDYGTVHVNQHYDLHILGGTIKAADSNGIAVSYYTYMGPLAGNTFIGGNPQINGSIMVRNERILPTVIATGENALAYGRNIYTLGLNWALENTSVIVKNGARFISSFEIATISSSSSMIESNAKFRLAASGDDIIATEGGIVTVNFSLNGGVGTVPTPIPVIEGGRLGELAMPPADYVNAQNFKSDGKWYIGVSRQSGTDLWTQIGNQFIFSISDGTRVNENITLVLDWTNEVSVTETDRVIPGDSNSEEASVIVPIIITAGEITAGPNVVTKRAGAVNIFRTGRNLQNGKLTVYGASGNTVKTINIIDNAVNGADKRIVGTWDLTDVRGRLVSEGTYLIKGVAVTRDGKKERVSVVVSVR